MPLARFLAVAIILSACTPAPRAPTPTEAVTAAINVTDSALAAAIAVAPYDQLPEYERRVAMIRTAADTVRLGRDLCPAVEDLSLLATVLRCADCETVTRAAREVLLCQ